MSLEIWMGEQQAGTCTIDIRPGFQQSSMTFTYLDDWLADPRAFAISPDLPLQRGPHTPASHRTTFRAFDDAAPDQWGRALVDAELRRQAKANGRRSNAPTEIDRLLAVDDQTRQGALRFRQDGTFLAAASPSAGVQELPMLAEAAQRFIDTGVVDEAVRRLVGVGSSPGGAQPKAWVREDDGSLHLAKFPRTNDVRDVSAWELTAIRLQRKAGIRVQPSRIIPLGPGSSIFVTRRFDREADHRIPYMSFRSAFALEPLEHPDYATLATRVAAISASPSEDAAELFSRAAFGAMANNIDDHMRNHGLLHSGNGWRLAPSFDVNPERFGHSDTPLTPEDDPAQKDIRLLVEQCGTFRLTAPEAIERIRQVAQAIAGWRIEAVGAGVEPDALDAMATAFEGESMRHAQAMVDGSWKPGAASTWVGPHRRSGRRIEGHYRRRG